MSSSAGATIRVRTAASSHCWQWCWLRPIVSIIISAPSFSKSSSSSSSSSCPDKYACVRYVRLRVSIVGAVKTPPSSSKRIFSLSSLSLTPTACCAVLWSKGCAAACWALKQFPSCLLACHAAHCPTKAPLIRRE